MEIGNFGQAQENQGIVQQAHVMYAAQEIQQIDAEIAQKDHFRMETDSAHKYYYNEQS